MPDSPQQRRLRSTGGLYRLLADPASFRDASGPGQVRRGKPGPSMPINAAVMDEIARITAEAADLLDQAAEAQMPLDGWEQFERALPRDLPGVYDWFADQWPALPAPLAERIDERAREHAAYAVRLLHGHPEVTRWLRCPECGCVSLIADPGHADVLLCTNRACSPGPGPRRFALADGAWDALVFGQAA